MALVFADRIKETTTTTGTGSVTLAGAVTGFRAFNVNVATGSLVNYCIDDGAGNWEVGYGIFTATSTLSRLVVMASSNANSLVSFAAGTKNVFVTASAAQAVTQSGVIYGQNGTTGCLAATYDRTSTVVGFTAGAPASGTMRVVLINLPAGLPVTNISFVSGTTAGGTLTHQWFLLANASTLSVLAKTADDTSTAWAATTKKSLAVTGGPFVTTYSGAYYLGYVVTATTLPTIEGISGANGTGARNLAPLPAGTSTTGLTTPASLGSTIAAVTIGAAEPYAEIS